MKKYVELFTDGACSGNPGPGGWGAILRYGDKEKELCGGEKETTNNRMELTAAIMGLKALKEPCMVRLVTEIGMEFDVQIPPEELIPENFQNVNTIWALIERLDEE